VTRVRASVYDTGVRLNLCSSHSATASSVSGSVLTETVQIERRFIA